MMRAAPLAGLIPLVYVRRNPNSTVDRRLPSFRSTTRSRGHADTRPVLPCAGRWFAILRLLSHRCHAALGSGHVSALRASIEQCSSGNVDFYSCQTLFFFFYLVHSITFVLNFWIIPKFRSSFFILGIIFIIFWPSMHIFITFCLPFFFFYYFLPITFHIMNYFHNVLFPNIFQILLHLFYVFLQKIFFRILVTNVCFEKFFA